MTNRKHFRRWAALLAGVALGMGPSAARQEGAADAGAPETVMVTLHAKAGAEDALARVLERHWATARRLNLVRQAPHLTLRGAETGNRAYFVDVFTWRDAAIPDAAPAEIRKIWDQMNLLVEARGGHAGLELAVVSVVAP